MAFAKLFERNGQQILVKKDVNEENFPEIQYFFEPQIEGFSEVGSTAITFKKNDKKVWKKVNEIFENVTEKNAFDVVNRALKDLREVFK